MQTVLIVSVPVLRSQLLSHRRQFREESHLPAYRDRGTWLRTLVELEANELPKFQGRHPVLHCHSKNSFTHAETSDDEA